MPIDWTCFAFSKTYRPVKQAARIRPTSKPKTERRRIADVRDAVFTRDGARCRVCGGPGTEIHELRFRSLGGQISERNSVCVCARCHTRLQTHRLRVGGANANQSLVFTEVKP